MGNQLGIIGEILFIFFINLFLLQILNWFLLFYLSYFSISYRIRTLKFFVFTITEPRDKRLRLCGYIFDQITQAVNELNLTFSFSVLVMLTILMVICATSLFIGLFTLSPDLRDQRNTFFFLSFIAIVFILIILTSAESPIVEVNNFNVITLSFY
jgi:hypothetical protein